MIERKPLPSVEKLNELFFYDPEDGMLYRRIQTNYKAQAGAEAGYIHKSTGYFETKIGSEPFLIHRLIWKMHYGTDPETLDHIDQDRLNNRIENLRSVTQSINVHNVPDTRYAATSEYRGVYKKKNTWVAAISFNKVRKYIGQFKTPEAARDAYLKEAKCLGLI